MKCTDSRDCCDAVGQYTEHYPNPNCDCPFHSSPQTAMDGPQANAGGNAAEQSKEKNG